MLNISEFPLVLVETADLFTNFDVRYAGAHPVMRLNTKYLYPFDGKCKHCNDGFTQFRGQFIVGHVNQLGIHDLLDFTNSPLIRFYTV